jgi:NAD+ kinase
VVEGAPKLLAAVAVEHIPIGSAGGQVRAGVPAALTRIGVVVHPSRPLERPLATLRAWGAERGVELVQVTAQCAQPLVASRGDSRECDLIVSIGGDGTTLAAIRAGAAAGLPVLGVACGSLGVLTTVEAHDLERALDRFADGEWSARRLPALAITDRRGQTLLAFNDIAIVRAGQGQIRVTATVDGALFARLAGDGCIVSTPVGSSAYALAAGGPLLLPDANAFLLTPLTAHGGRCPPLVMHASSRVGLETATEQSRARLEVDGVVTPAEIRSFSIEFCAAVATTVSFPEDEPPLAGLRRRRLIIDSPRVLAEDVQRSGGGPARTHRKEQQ